jgi:hypothetical protein
MTMTFLLEAMAIRIPALKTDSGREILRDVMR